MTTDSGPPRTSRRDVLRGAVGVAASALLTFPPRMVWAQPLADGELIVVSDGNLTLPMSFVFPDAPAAELEALLAANGMPLDALRPDCHVTVLRTGDRLVLFDAGSGANFMPTAGRLPDNLAAAGIDPAEITDVVFTHAHPDHIWGVTDDFDDPAFPNAAFHIGHAEWDFWSAPDAIASVPEDRQTFVVGAQNRFAAIEDRVAFVRPGDEVVPGVEAVDTSGHTPGHLSFMVHGGADPVLVGGDALTNVVISFARPEWPTGSDQDPEMGIRTRLSLLDRLASERVRLIGYHFPHPGAGFVERDGTAYRYVPV